MLLAESLVDEWLNREGFFTVRGWKDGVREIDLLGVRSRNGLLEAVHVEVQASMRPVAYIAPLPTRYVPSFASSTNSAKVRPESILEDAVDAWVMKKYNATYKAKARDRAWPGLSWRMIFVHAVVKDSRELERIAASGVEVIPVFHVLKQLGHVDGGQRGGAGTDLSEIIEYYTTAARTEPDGPKY